MLGVSQQAVPAPLYRMTIRLGMERGDNQKLHAADFEADIIGMPTCPYPTQHVGLLGRDFLSGFRLVYDGPDDAFKIVLIEDKITPQTRLLPGSPRGLQQKRQRKALKRNRSK